MRKLFFLFAIPVLFAGCQEIIELDLDDPEPELVIEGYLAGLDFWIPDSDLRCSEDDIIPRDSLLFYAAFAELFDIDSIAELTDYFPYNRVKLSLTAAYFSNAATPRVSNATVRLYEDGSLVETLAESTEEAGIYLITYDPVVDAMYHLEVEAEIGGTTKLYETTPEPYLSTPPILETAAVYNPDPLFGDSAAYYLNISTYEVPGLGDHYTWSFYINNEYQSDPGDISITPDDGIDGACVPGSDVYGDPIDLGAEIAVFQSRVSQKHHDFLSNIRQQTAFVGGPFDTPPAPIVGNVKNVTDGGNAFGYFVPAAVTVGFTTVPDTIPAEFE